jgi:hypothetical protein
MNPVEAGMWRAEYETLNGRFEALRARLRAEGESALLRRDRLRRVDACVAALLGFSEALAD